MIKNRVEKKKYLRTNFVKSYSFHIQTLICLIHFAQVINDDVIQLTSKE